MCSGGSGKPITVLVVSGGSDKTIRFWDATNQKEKASLRGHEGGIRSLAFSSDEKTLASASDDGTVKLWNAATEAEQKTLKGHTGEVWRTRFSDDGTRITAKTVAAGKKRPRPDVELDAGRG